ncbi:MAG: RNase E specificity factor CsrD [Psychromonas sp.]|jgi:RNase E specificity factor CsrD|uniref:EAL domain-containing protein n=1 Tax=Psychromonas sp. TaxID=1884585 RepID=UPI0039E3CCEF
MKFTDKFTFKTAMIVFTCVALILVGGLISLKFLTVRYHQQRIDTIVKVIEYQLDKKVTAKQLQQWLPDLLDASDIVGLQIKYGDSVFFNKALENNPFYSNNLLISYEYQLKKSPKIELILQTLPSDSVIFFPIVTLIAIASVVLLTILILIITLFWIKKQLVGADLLENRAKHLLQNNPTARFSQSGEWPLSASKALDLLSEQLEQSREISSTFDQYIREQAFLDKTTGLGNSLAFDNALDLLLQDRNVLSSAILMINFNELESIAHKLGGTICDEMLLQIAELLTHFAARYPDHFIGRISNSQFVLIIPQMTYQETEVLAKQLTKSVFQLFLPKPFLIDDFFHIGVVSFNYGTKKTVLLDDLKRALIVATHQKVSGWFMADDLSDQVSFYKGTVHWRALLGNILAKDRLLLYRQRVLQRDGVSELYSEIWPRIKDHQQQIISAGVFLPMAEKCGLHQKYDRQILEKTLILMTARGEKAKPIAVNLGAQIITDKSTQKWLFYELLQLPRRLRHHLIIEISETLLQDNYPALRSALIAIQKMGCQIAVDNVGKKLANTKYIIDFNLDYLKLYAGLIRNIHLRKTNQVAVQSLVASCLNSHTKIIAVGVESEEEWQCLLKLGIYAGQGDFFSPVVPLCMSKLD